MKYEKFVKEAQRAARYAERNYLDDALKIFAKLAEEDLPAKDRAMMALNAAIVNERLGHGEAALGWLRKGALFEAETGETLVREKLARFEQDFSPR